jgi:hypothetical protein
MNNINNILEVKVMKKVITLCLVVLFAVNAQATILGTVNIENHNNALSDIGQLFSPSLGSGSGGSYYTGIYSWTNMGGTGLGTQVPNWGFCIELTQGPYNGWQNLIRLEEAPESMAMGTTKANYIRELWGRDFDPTWITNPTTANKQLAEAFGACLWEIIYETGGSPATWNVLTGSGFHAAGIEDATTANGWLRSLNGDTAYFANNLAATSTPNGQDYLVQLPTPIPPIPEPATICLLGFGALSLIRRKK